MKRPRFFHENILSISNADNGGASNWIGDGFCDDMNNNEACSYDDGDCCGLLSKKNFCVDCICKGKSNNSNLLKEIDTIFIFS